MKPTCTACGSPLLETDTHCFRCGAELQQLKTPPLPEPETQVDLRAAAFYGGLVVTLLIVGALLMNWMGAGARDPLAPTPTPSAPAGWIEYIAPEEDFRLWLPSDWRFSRPGSLEWEETARQISHPLPDSLKRVGSRDPADQLTLVAKSLADEGELPAELSVAYYAGLVDLSLGVVQTDSWWAGERWLDASKATRVIQRESGGSALIADLIYPAGNGDTTESVTMIIKTARDTYVMTVSATVSDSGLADTVLPVILDSFRPLDTP